MTLNKRLNLKRFNFNDAIKMQSYFSTDNTFSNALKKQKSTVRLPPEAMYRPSRQLIPSKKLTNIINKSIPFTFFYLHGIILLIIFYYFLSIKNYTFIDLENEAILLWYYKLNKVFLVHINLLNIIIIVILIKFFLRIIILPILIDYINNNLLKIYFLVGLFGNLSTSSLL